MFFICIKTLLLLFFFYWGACVSLNQDVKKLFERLAVQFYGTIRKMLYMHFQIFLSFRMPNDYIDYFVKSPAQLQHDILTQTKTFIFIIFCNRISLFNVLQFYSNLMCFGEMLQQRQICIRPLLLQSINCKYWTICIQLLLSRRIKHKKACGIKRLKLL